MTGAVGTEWMGWGAVVAGLKNLEVRRCGWLEHWVGVMILRFSGMGFDNGRALLSQIMCVT